VRRFAEAAQAPAILRVAVATPLRRLFDYLAPAGSAAGAPAEGARVRVPFGRGTRIGLVLGRAAESALSPERLKPVLEVIDPAPLLPAASVDLLKWASAYYHHPPGEVVQAALPGPLRRGRAAEVRGVRRWRLTSAGAAVDPDRVRGAPRQSLALRALGARPEGLPWGELRVAAGECRGALQALARKGWVTAQVEDCLSAESSPVAPVTLEPDQRAAVDAVAAAWGRFRTFLLDGVTGSGKTEVYLTLIEQVAAQGAQALVLVPEIALTPQLVARFRGRLRVPVAVLHSGLTDEERVCAWLAAREARAPVVVGTRSAALAPLARPGVFIVDEEHDPSFKQHEGFRYSARDLAVFRGRAAGVPVVLGSATPSLESLHNVRQGRYQHLLLARRAAGTRPPALEVVDLRGRRFDDGLSARLLEAVAANLAAGEQTLLFLNRRGFAPVLLCHACGWVADCVRCDAHLVYHRSGARLRCHHCGAERRVPVSCPECRAADLRAVGLGTQKVADALARHFPRARIARMDRDSVRRKGALEGVLADIERGAADIVVGTQMLAKGHHFPNVTLVGIVDADAGLFSVDFRASERMAQLVVQVSGRAGRGERAGRVLIQTHHPAHPLLRALIRHGYAHFAGAALAERGAARLPPFTALALLRAEARSRGAGHAFLEEAAQLARGMRMEGVSLLGPVPAPMERRAGRYRAQLLLEAEERAALHRLLAAWTPALEALRSGRRVRWALDVDPQDMV